MRWWRPSLLAAAALALALAACTRGGPESPPPAPASQQTPTPGAAQPTPAPALPGGAVCIETVVIQDGRAAPETLNVTAPCVVLFSNRGESVAQIQGHDFLLGEMAKDQSWAHTYKEPGAFEYVDIRNAGIRGRVIVRR